MAYLWVVTHMIYFTLKIANGPRWSVFFMPSEDVVRGLVCVLAHVRRPGSAKNSEAGDELERRITMKKTIEQMIDDVLRREGGYVNHPADKGGPTKYGITQKTLTSWRLETVTAEDVKALGEEEARKIYRTLYYLRPKLERLPADIQPQVFDISVNSGPERAVRLLQQVLNEEGFGPLVEDGKLGALTDSAANLALRTLGAAKINNLLVDERCAFYCMLATTRPSQQVFLKGWLKRAEEFREGA